MQPFVANLADPPSATALGAALTWIEVAATGTIAGAITILAVAAVGAMMLTGRIDLRRGLAVVLGCFLIFGARTLSSSLQHLASDEPPSAVTQTVPPLPIANLATAQPPNDPYAGASVRY